MFDKIDKNAPVEVYFLEDGTKQYVGYGNNFDEAFDVMREYLTNTLNFKSYYTRFWGFEEGLKCDYGSHTKFMWFSNLKAGE